MTENLEMQKQYMRRAIELAASAAGHTSPNPMVGAVIVKDGRILAEGCHERYGDLHAERNALSKLQESAEGAEMYVTLEPCCHYGKQPPCTEAVIASGVKKVYVGSYDPNPLVAGKGIQLLRNAGIEVVEGFMEKECDELNPIFFHFITSGEPFIALKYAMTADGKIATDTGKSQWITGEDARKHVHELRNYYKGILVGIGTVLADDPLLNCRLEGGVNPIRIVLDTKLRIPEDCRLVKTAADIPLIVFCGETEASEQKDKITRLQQAGVEVIEVPVNSNGQVEIEAVIRKLGERKIDSVLVEGGGNVNASFVKAGKVNCVYTYIGAKIFGGSGKYTPVSGAGIDGVEEALNLSNPKVQNFGDDILIRYETTKRPSRIRA